MKPIKTTNNSIDSKNDFSEYHLKTAENINSYINRRDIRKLGKIIRCIPRADYWQVIYAFYELYGYSYNSKIQSMDIHQNELKMFGLI